MHCVIMLHFCYTLVVLFSIGKWTCLYNIILSFVCFSCQLAWVLPGVSHQEGLWGNRPQHLSPQPCIWCHVLKSPQTYTYTQRDWGWGGQGWGEQRAGHWRESSFRLTPNLSAGSRWWMLCSFVCSCYSQYKGKMRLLDQNDSSSSLSAQ